MRTKPPGRVYVAQGRNGLLKVGYATRPTERVKLLREQFLARGDELERVEFCISTNRPLSVESTVVRFCKDNYPRKSGLEWFAHGCFDTVKALAEAESERCKAYPPLPLVTREEMAARRERMAARRLQRLVEMAARREQRARRARRGCDRRNRAARVFLAIVAAVAAEPADQKAA